MATNIRYLLVPVIIVIVFLGATWFLTPSALEIRENPPVGSLLAALFTVALFMERSLEVFINVWRSTQKKELENAMESAPDDDAKTAAAARLSAYRTQTQVVAMWTSFGFGLFISAVGMRTLESLVTPESLGALSINQVTLFHMADVLLTGGLISGGSEGVHKITQVYTDFMEATSARLKAQRQDVENPG